MIFNLYSSFKKIFFFFDSTFQKKFLFLFLLIFLNSFLEVVSIATLLPLASFLIDENNIIKFKNLFLLDDFTNQQIINFTLLTIFIFFTIKFFLTIFVYNKQNKLVFAFMHNLLSKVYSRYLFQPYSFFLKKNTSNLITNLSTQTPEIIYGFIIPILTLFSELLILIFILIFLFLINYKVLIVAIILGIISFFFIKIVNNQIKLLSQIRMFNEKKKIQYASQSLLAIKEIKIFDRYEYFLKKFSKYSLITSNTLSKYFTFIEIPKIFLEYFGFLFLILLIIVLNFLGNDYVKIIPLIAVFSISAYRIIPSASRIINAIQRVRFTIGSVNSVLNEIKNYKNNPEDEYLDKARPLRVNKFIFLKNIYYKYNNSKNNIFKNFNLKIKKNEFLGIYGNSGSGKTTLINILLGLLAPNRGNVLIDNYKIKNNLKNWYANIGYVPQITHLLDSSVKENIRLGFFGKSTLSIKKTLELAQIKSFVYNLKKKENTNIGEDGVKISGGQRQRLGIARAIYRNPEVLILDEPTSALDPITELKFMKILLKMKKKKTIIIVSHKESVLKQCDRIVKI